MNFCFCDNQTIYISVKNKFLPTPTSSAELRGLMGVDGWGYVLSVFSFHYVDPDVDISGTKGWTDFCDSRLFEFSCLRVLVGLDKLVDCYTSGYLNI